MAKGIIYVMTTSVDGLIKIGKTQTENYESRIKSLEQNGYWNVSGLHRFCAFEVDDYDEKEKLIHTIFSKSQVSTSELFALDKNLAKDMLEAFEGRQVYPALDPDVTKTLRLPRRSPFRFSMCGLKEGDRVQLKGDPSVEAEVMSDDRHVMYEGRAYVLSNLTRKLLGRRFVVFDPADWTHQGVTLEDLRLQREAKEQAEAEE